MMRTKRLMLNISTLLASLLLVLSVGFTSCYKEPSYTAEITVVDANNAKVSGAKVELSYSNNLWDEGVTNAQGKVSFTYDDDLALDILATEGNRSGTGFVKLENHETVKVTVVIQ